MLRDLTLPVAGLQEGERLDRLVQAAFPGIRRTEIAHAFERGELTVDGIPVPKGRRATAGETIRIARLHEPDDQRAIPGEGALEVVFEDEALLAFNKPGGQNCHPLLPGESGTLVNAMLARYPELAGIGDDARMPALLHRIDAGTSGLVLAARSQRDFENVRAQFASHRIEKGYRALVEGRLESPGGISGHLAHVPGDRGRMRSVSPRTCPRGERALAAETFYRPIRRFARHTLLEVTLRTGVTHQIRCQLAEIGHPVAGDATYGTTAPESAPGAPRHFLHARSVTLRHPRSGREQVLEAPLTNDFRDLLERLSP